MLQNITKIVLIYSHVNSFNLKKKETKKKSKIRKRKEKEKKEKKEGYEEDHLHSIFIKRKHTLKNHPKNFQ